MTKFEKEYMEKQFAKAVKACEATVKKCKCIKEFTVMRKDKFWATWAKVNGYSRYTRKTHRFVAVLRLSFGIAVGKGSLYYTMSNNEAPEIAALDVLKLALAGWNPYDVAICEAFPNYKKAAKANAKSLSRAIDTFVKAMEAPEKKKVRKAYNIQWDTDGATLKECGLPRSVVIPDNVAYDEVGDWLSDTYGFCHEGYLTNFEE